MILFRVLIVFSCLIFTHSTYAQVLIDEQFEDWTSKPVILDDNGDGAQFSDDFLELQITNDDEHLYFRLLLDDEILLQENNTITMYLDVDNDPSTGTSQASIGADVSFSFGARDGLVINDFQWMIFHDDLELVVLPSLSSKEFEWSIAREFENPGQGTIFLDGTIGVVIRDDRSGGDIIPESSADQRYTFDNSIETIEVPYDLEKLGGGFRLMTYNSLFDGLFDPPQEQAQERIIAAIDADMYAFVEIYDFNSDQIAEKIIQLSSHNGTWYHASEGNDTHLISKYPIKDHTNIDGNGAYLVEYEDAELLIIVAHLPAGTNDSGRQMEADRIMAFIRDAKIGFNEFQLKAETPIIITGDFNLYGDQRQRYTLLSGDIQNNAAFGPDEEPDWDNTGLVSALPFATGSTQAITWRNNNSSFFPGRLDYTFYSDFVLDLRNNFSLYTQGLTNTQLNTYGLLSSDSRVGSDHYPLITDFELKNMSNTAQTALNDLLIYPNPATEYLVISNVDLGSRYTIKSIDGTIVKEGTLTSTFAISISNLITGSYILTITSGKGVKKSTKFIIQE